MVETTELHYHRLETSTQAMKLVKLVERKARQLGTENEYSGQIKALRDILDAANILAGDIIENLEEKK